MSSWLCEAFCLHTPFNPEVAENQGMINAAFVSQGHKVKITKP
jgi:hypothetical protein